MTCVDGNKEFVIVFTLFQKVLFQMLMILGHQKQKEEERKVQITNEPASLTDCCHFLNNYAFFCDVVLTVFGEKKT